MLAVLIKIPGGSCAQAHELYARAFGMVVRSVTYNDEAPAGYHEAPLAEAARKLVLHSECSLFGTRVNMSDDANIAASTGAFNVFLPTEAEVLRAFDILKEGGVVEHAPAPVFWSPLFCVVADRFGVKWSVMVE